jgi:predicted ATPase/class 3 adenylate cyclase
MQALSVFLPRDRCHALEHGLTLADRTQGSALFADISGFTPLTEALAVALGPQRGAEELTRHLNHVYDALIAQVHRFRGSVISFAGDAITCWFENDAAQRATAAALGMQQAMRTFGAVEIPGGGTIALAMKAAVAAGPARRFLIGDPSIQRLDTLAGATLARMAAGEHLAERGEVVLDAPAAERLEGAIALSEWRIDPHTQARHAVVTRFLNDVPDSPWLPAAAPALTEAVARPWLLPPVFARLETGSDQFLAELRPAVVLFLNFEGIDYDNDPEAGAKLDAYVAWVQRTLQRYEAYVLGVTIGDKGSYLYAAFGAPTAHDDDATRACTAAIELRATAKDLRFIGPPRIGLNQGRVWSGAYGGTQRCTYGVLGDAVNLAARLMQASAPGGILVGATVRQSARDLFEWQSRSALRVKGKKEPVTAFHLDGARTGAVIRLQEPRYDIPMVGRATELGQMRRVIEATRRGASHMAGINGEAGLGKSRLLAEVIREAAQARFLTLGGECQSYGTNTPYLVWQSIWRNFFGLKPEAGLETQTRTLEQRLRRIDPRLIPRLPLLGVVLNLPLPDNDLTRTMDAKLRKTSLESLLVDCLRLRPDKQPLFLALEDCHWMDPLSQELLRAVHRALRDLPATLLMLAYRPPPPTRPEEDWSRSLEGFVEVRLSEFTPAEAARLIRTKLAQSTGFRDDVPAALLERVTSRAQGNPFYIEELLNYVRDLGIDPGDAEALQRLTFPDSLHSLILSRIDQLTEHQKITLKVASVIGRQFRAAWLWGGFPSLGDVARVRADLEALSRLDLTPLDLPDPDLTFIFKHIATQEVAYESLVSDTRVALHDQLAGFIEHTYADSLEQQVNLLAYHYDRTQNLPKKRHYLRRAGEAAQAAYANAAAIDYYRRLIPLLTPDDQVPVMLKLGQVLELVGHWEDARRTYEKALASAESLADARTMAWCETSMSDLLRKQARYAEATTWLERARARFEAAADEAGVAQTLHFGGTVLSQQGDHATARTLYERSLAIRRKLADKPRIASLLSNLGIVARCLGDLATARALYEESLRLRRELGDRWAIANSLNNLGLVFRFQNDYAAARALLEESVAINRQVGDPWAIANSLASLAEITLDQGDHAAANAALRESLALNRGLGERRAMAYLFESFAILADASGRHPRAVQLIAAAAALREALRTPISPVEKARLDQILDRARAHCGEAACAAASTTGTSMPIDGAIQFALESQT